MECKPLTRFILLLWLLLPVSAWAAGLGDIQVRSYLNQQFQATIPIIGLNNVPSTSVTASLASEKEFSSIGLTKDINLSNLQFNVQQNQQQQLYIKVTSAQPTVQPVITFLLQLNWSGGHLLREYTVFLDPPSYSSAKSTMPATTATNQPMTQMAPSKAKPARATYGPTTAQDNLWAIVQPLSNPQGPTAAQVMLATVKLNPQAFVNNNINGLKSGYLLNLPTAAQSGQLGDQQAQTMLAQQNQAWQDRTQTTVLPSSPDDFSVTDDTDQVNAQIPSAPAPIINNDNQKTEPVITQETTLNEPPLAPNPANMQVLENEVAISAEAMETSEKANQSLQVEIKALQTQVLSLQQQLTGKEQELSAAKQAQIIGNGGEIKANQAIKWFLSFCFLLVIIAAVILSIRLKLPWHKLKDLKFKPSTITATPILTPEPESELKPEAATAKIEPLQQPQQGIEIETAAPIIVNSDSAVVDPHSTAAILDIVDEADVYLTYGRYEKAESLLRNSLLTNPTQLDLRFKLLDIYQAQQNKIAFDKELSLLGPLDNLPTGLQKKLAKLLEAWNPAENNEYFSANETSSNVSPATTKPVTETSNTADRMIEFDGDLSGLYPQQAPAEKPAVQTEPPISVDEAKPLETVAEPINKAEPVNSVQTDLDLAQAYLDMGDAIEAHALLEKIAQEGNEQQQQSARTLIEDIKLRSHETR